MEKVALQAGRAAPAVAIAGALVAAPTASHALASAAKPTTATAGGHQTATTAKSPDTAAGTRDTASAGSKATLDSLTTRTVTVAAAKPARHSAAAQSTYYQVQSGDTLSRIAERFYHQPADWQYLYQVNDKTVSNPNLIFAGERLLIPAAVPAHYAATGYVPRHAAAPVITTASQHSSGSGSSGGGHSSTVGGGSVVVQEAASGSYSCPGLEAIWEEAGGNPADAFMAAEIAEAESGGNPNAISPTDDYGLWQINIANGALATLNPLANAKSAIILSDDGTNWDAWTTYHSGAYYGKC